ncbi:MAG TPA: CAP domain-containing protein [Polyangia bacterium]|nr:CAP domain-containing protein [Polyangia bacterium]
MASLEVAVADAVDEVRRTGTRCAGVVMPPVAPLSRSAALDCAARAHSAAMAARGFFDHRDPDGRDPAARARRAGYDADVGENLSWGQRSGSEVLHAWLASPGHCRNLMSPARHATGVGVARGAEGKIFFTQLYGTK